jgi:hypothetical protein
MNEWHTALEQALSPRSAQPGTLRTIEGALEEWLVAAAASRRGVILTRQDFVECRELSTLSERCDTRPSAGTFHLGLVEPVDVSRVHALTQRSYVQHWRHSRPSVGLQTFAAELELDVLSQRTIRRSDGTFAGYLCLYDAEWPAGIAWLEVWVAPGLLQQEPAVAGPIIDFIRDALRTWPLRKLYFEIPEKPYAWIKSGDFEYFKTEATLHDHWRDGSGFTTVYICSISRAIQ